ncbi:MAG: outer membrane beta-barrel protein [Terracidiphilus sp.]|jgi:hypothetical protein
MQVVVKNVFAVFCIPALFLLASLAPANAQVVANSGEIAGNIGYDHTSYTPSDGPTSTHFLGFSSGYNVTHYLTALGEYKYDPLSNVDGASYHSQLYGGAARFNLHDLNRTVPYAIAGFGGYRLTGSESGTTVSVSHNGYYFNFGGGASVYLARNWGIRPEVRYERQHVTADGENIHANVMDLSGSFFYQWGGTGRGKK